MRVTDVRVGLDPLAGVGLYLNVLALSTFPASVAHGYVLACLGLYNDSDPSVVANRCKAF